MRLVSHPNVVDLKAFFYSNGDKVSWFTLSQLFYPTPFSPPPEAVFLLILLYGFLKLARKTKSILILYWNSSPKQSTAPVAIMPNSNNPCRCCRSSCTCTSYSVLLPTSTLLGYATGISSHKTYYSTRRRVCSSCVTLGLPRSWLPGSRMLVISARDTIERPN